MRCSGVILAGGDNTRMNGHPKAMLRLDGRSYLERIAAAMRDQVEGILVVSRTPGFYRHPSWSVVEDILPQRSPLAGIHAGLVYSRNDFVFCSSCDMPLLSSALVGMVIGAVEPGYDIVVPANGTYYQPLCSVYSKRCIGPIEDLLAKDDFKVDHLFSEMIVKKVPYEELQTADPQLNSFFNVNSPADKATANSLLGNRDNRQLMELSTRPVHDDSHSHQSD